MNYELQQHLLDKFKPIATICSGYINDVNSFPAIALLKSSISTGHYSNNSRIFLSRFVLRVYCYNDSDPLDELEELLRQIEVIIQERDYSWQSLRVRSVSTDEGLLYPYAMGEIECEMLWLTEPQ